MSLFGRRDPLEADLEALRRVPKPRRRVEAEQWIRDAAKSPGAYMVEGAPHVFAMNHFGPASEALAFVRKLYRTGATRVEVGEITRDVGENDPTAATLFITMPKGSRAEKIMAVIAKQCPDELEKRGKVWRAWWD
jgi:hypothetical protein